MLAFYFSCFFICIKKIPQYYIFLVKSLPSSLPSLRTCHKLSTPSPVTKVHLENVFSLIVKCKDIKIIIIYNYNGKIFYHNKKWKIPDMSKVGRVYIRKKYYHIANRVDNKNKPKIQKWKYRPAWELSWLEHGPGMPRLCVWIPVRAHIRSKQERINKWDNRYFFLSK